MVAWVGNEDKFRMRRESREVSTIYYDCLIDYFTDEMNALVSRFHHLPGFRVDSRSLIRAMTFVLPSRRSNDQGCMVLVLGAYMFRARIGQSRDVSGRTCGHPASADYQLLQRS